MESLIGIDTTFERTIDQLELEYQQILRNYYEKSIPSDFSKLFQAIVHGRDKKDINRLMRLWKKELKKAGSEAEKQILETGIKAFKLGKERAMGHLGEMILDVPFGMPDIHALQYFMDQYTIPALANLSEEITKEIEGKVKDFVTNYGQNLTDLEKSIRGSLTDVVNVRYKAHRIARTELGRCANNGYMMHCRDKGYDLYDWLDNSGSCPDCASLAAGGPYTYEELDIASNSFMPHPNCRCRPMVNREGELRTWKDMDKIAREKLYSGEQMEIQREMGAIFDKEGNLIKEISGEKQGLHMGVNLTKNVPKRGRYYTVWHCHPKSENPYTFGHIPSIPSGPDFINAIKRAYRVKNNIIATPYSTWNIKVNRRFSRAAIKEIRKKIARIDYIIGEAFPRFRFEHIRVTREGKEVVVLKAEWKELGEDMTKFYEKTMKRYFKEYFEDKSIELIYIDV